ncbi:MAG: AraC family transcriptional regulator [Saccharofermentanales bacterium]
MSDFIKNKLNSTLIISEIITILYFKFTKDYKFRGETHNFWEFIYIDKGELIITAGEQLYILKAGELAFHMPNEFHDIQANGTVSPNVIVVTFTCRSRCMDFFRNRILFLSDDEKHLLSYIVKESSEVFNPIESRPPNSGMVKKPAAPFGAEQIIRHDLEKLLISIYRRQDSIHRKQRSLRVNQHHGYTAIVEKIVEILENNVHNKLSLAAISSQVNLSVSQIKKVFRQEVGDSIISYFIALKIDEARCLIDGSGLNFTQISETLGYDNIGYFSRIFKQRTGMTPSEYALSVRK